MRSASRHTARSNTLTVSLLYTKPAVMAYFFSTPVDIDVVLEDTSDRQMVDVKLDKNRREKAPLYKDEESVRGAVTVRPKDGKRLEHTGIKVQFIGTIGRFLLSLSPPVVYRCVGMCWDVQTARKSRTWKQRIMKQ